MKFGSCNCKNIALFVVRIIVGVLFVIAGWQKVSNMTATVDAFSQMGFSAPIAYIVSYLELIGGVLLVLGIYTQYAAIVLGIIMIGAVYKTWGAGMQVFATPLALLASLIGLSGTGSGSFALKPCKCCDGCNSCNVEVKKEPSVVYPNEGK